MKTEAQVAVIIASYNASKTVARAVRSALAEAEVAEVILVDDASTDDTAARAREADDGSGRLRVLRQAENKGPSAARNLAIRESKSPWIGILDADDFFLPGRTAGLLSFARDADFVADDMWQVPETNVDGPRRVMLGETLHGPRFVDFREFVLSNVSGGERGRGNDLGFIKPLMRRDFLDAHNLRYQEHMRLGEDYELYARALALGARLNIVPAQGYISVIRPDSLSARHSETDLLHLRDCDEALRRDLALPEEDRAVLRRHYLSVDCRLQWRLLINAVKSRDAGACLRTFLRPWPVPLYNMQQLARQAYLRTFRRGGAK